MTHALLLKDTVAPSFKKHIVEPPPQRRETITWHFVCRHPFRLSFSMKTFSLLISFFLLLAVTAQEGGPNCDAAVAAAEKVASEKIAALEKIVKDAEAKVASLMSEKDVALKEVAALKEGLAKANTEIAAAQKLAANSDQLVAAATKDAAAAKEAFESAKKELASALEEVAKYDKATILQHLRKAFSKLIKNLTGKRKKKAHDEH